MFCLCFYMLFPIEIPGAFSDGFNIKVFPHVTAIGNICRELQSESKNNVGTVRLKMASEQNY